MAEPFTGVTQQSKPSSMVKTAESLPSADPKTTQTSPISTASPANKTPPLHSSIITSNSDNQLPNLVKVAPQQTQSKASAHSTKAVDIVIAGQSFTFTPSQKQAAQLQQATNVMVTQQQVKQLLAQSMVQSSSAEQAIKQTVNAKSHIQSQLILLAQTVSLALPEALHAQANSKGVNQQQLLRLAASPQGYPLPMAQLDGSKLTFTQGSNITLDKQIQLPKGEYLATIVMTKNGLTLQLTQVVNILQVNMKPNHTTPLSHSTHSDEVIAKIEPAQVLFSLLKKLDNIPFSLKSATQSNEHSMQSNSSQHKTSSRSEGLTTVSIPVKSFMAALKPNPELARLPSVLIHPNTDTGTRTGTSPQDYAAKLATLFIDPIKNALSTIENKPINQLNQQVVPAKSHTHLSSSQLTQASGQQATNSSENVPAVKSQPLINNEFNSLLNAGLNMASLKMLSAQSQVNTATNTQTNTSPMDVLHKALNKAGAVTADMTQTANIKTSLVSELLKLVPQIHPKSLLSLASPQQLRAEMLSLASLQLTQSAITHHATNMMSGGAITSLFQILLGVRATAQNKTVSARLAAHIQKLQQSGMPHLAHSGRLFNALDKASTLESLAQVSNSFNLYQQASSDPNQATTWYFAVPYSLQQKQEQFEGKFTREEDDNGNKPGWKLQLKFNITQGAMIITAHKRGEQLDLTVQGNNQATITKVERYQQALQQKLADIGFNPGHFITQINPIPATLLPGDHFLVKTRA